MDYITSHNYFLLRDFKMILEHYAYLCKHFPPPLVTIILSAYYASMIFLIIIGISATQSDLRYFNM